MFEKEISALLSKELVVALGCTEPIAIALAAAAAAKYAKAKECKITSIELLASGNIIKNAMSVNIPGTGSCGIKLATALGVVVGDDEKGLEVLSGLSKDQIEAAKSMISDGIISADLSDSSKKLYIEVIVHTMEGYARVIIEDSHTNIAFVEVNGDIIKNNCSNECSSEEEEIGSKLSIGFIYEFVNNFDIDKFDLIKQSITLNRRIGLEGLKNSYGLEVGKTIKAQIDSGIISNDIVNYAMALTSAASDARMAGCTLSVMSNSGSGNQGITATLPVVAVWEKLNLPYEKLIRAVALSHLMTIYIKIKFGRLSALCGATVAATGSSCGIVYLYGGDEEKIKYTIQNMLGNVTGTLCDGAKAGCALKVSTCTNAAMQSAILALKGTTIKATDGIIENDVEKTIDNVCMLANEGTRAADKIILDIMLNKE
ncbi:L-cysteine desulfidase family protein [Clostridium guangxiense]|uniref:L-cysteine desulfidase family protein n=1 Tax=Clostridium guangxiense TaxID=1662055 RepID=UPI001E5E5E5D|nr:L-serine ammonia-lyase, iron-sulfur-dependent, subunit alpha [Clostridium guangxiense]MCD2346902.1 L-serine ammonia-lyase, iron-sulfur-dependent, subunit alpha [Clostridium guangxiense]